MFLVLWKPFECAASLNGFFSNLDYYLNHCPHQVWFIGIQTGLGSLRKKLNCKNTSYRRSQRRWTQLWGRSTGPTHCIYRSVQGRPTWSGRFLGSFWNRFYQWADIDLLSKDANACQPHAYAMPIPMQQHYSVLITRYLADKKPCKPDHHPCYGKVMYEKKKNEHFFVDELT